MIKKYFYVFILLLLGVEVIAQENLNLERAQMTLDSIYKYFGVPGSDLLRENYPLRHDYKADYLGGGAHAHKSNPYSYLWPYSGSLSVHTALLSKSKNKMIKASLENRVIPGLEKYLDNRTPIGYASYVNFAPLSDRFYDDNVWLGIDFTDLYLLSKEKRYLKKAEEIWRFVQSGMDDKLGGGIYWCEQRKESKNTCSNAPSIVYLAKLYQATENSNYLHLAKTLYAWTQSSLMDESDSLYFDNINLSAQVDKRKYTYNSGQMIQAGALLYKLTHEKRYLYDAQNVAKSAYEEFFVDRTSAHQESSSYKVFKSGNIWFIAVMVRGFAELATQDRNYTYIQAIQRNLDFAWENMREPNGLFNKDWKGIKKEANKWLLDQFAMSEMYAVLASIKSKE